MAVRIGSNIAALRAQRDLANSTSELSKTFQRLSSGLRINKAADDAAGIAISNSLSTDSRVFSQGIRNFNDGVSLLNIADSAIESLSNITMRITELAEQAANGSYSATQRKALNSEAQALSDEFARISASTSFNGRYLFSGSTGQMRLQGGYGTDGGIASSLGGAIGTGVFGAATSYASAEVQGEAIALGDLNGDGNLDLVAGIDDGSDGAVNVRLGNGSGGFGSAQVYSTSSSSFSDVNLGDFNGDGILDILTSEANGNILRLGNGSGSFGSAVTFSNGYGPGESSLGDVNGDGNLDLVSAQGGYVAIILGSGNGTFTSGGTYAMDTTTRDVALGDINGDGLLDMVTGGITGVGTATIRLGTGNGTFGGSTSYTMDSAARTIQLADVNNDGKSDIITAGTGGVTYRVGAGDGTFGAATTLVIAGTNNIVRVEDLNGDGLNDIISNNTRLHISLANGAGSFATSVSYTMDNTINDFTLGDLNNDGVADVVSTGDNGGAPTINSRLQGSTSGIQPILNFTLETKADALQALSLIQRKRELLSLQRGTIGAFQSRLSTGISTLESSKENYTLAASRITDADVAQEAADLVRLQILQKSSAAILAQASQQPALAVKLIANE